MQFVSTGVVVAVLALVAVLARRERRDGFPEDPERPSYRMPRAYPAVFRVCAAGFLLGAAFCAYTLYRGNPTAAGALPVILGAAALCLLLAAYYSRWRLEVDGDGVHLRRMLLPDRDVPWGSLDAVGVAPSHTLDDYDVITLVSGGRRALSVQRGSLGGGASPELLLDAARRRGVPVASPLELPPGLSPWGPARRWYEGLPGWRRGLVALVSIVVFSAVFLLLVVLLMR
ncbi:hypothetical protein [Olsenella profusa]|uniref:PH domain-containing protein n=1 Tax=Olsenella profusa F0195 TaxID=1125712 RepID=U2VAM1_9ACTN|nr:hypothetical protein [Olsenella profusa]ERL09646.1 hypothetical protein HMPREF1316_2493 [Olsenella profusa F0195]